MSAWKPKEKQLSKEEAIALARREFARCWFGSGPLIAGLRTGDKVSAFPLDPTITERPWVVFFVNPTDIVGQSVTTFAREIQRRYVANNVGVLLVLRPLFQFVRDSRSIELWIKRHQVGFPVVIDNEGLLATAFNVKELPSVALIDKNRLIALQSGMGAIEKSEAILQSFLRTSDPGLALLPVLNTQGLYRRETPGISFGRNRGAKFPEPGFVPFSGEFGSAMFDNDRPESLRPGALFIKGRWLQDADRIVTSDPDAAIGVYCPTAGLSVVAQSMAKTQESTKLVIEVDGAPAYEMFGAEDLVIDEEGKSAVKIEGPRLYHVLATLPPGKRQLTIRFPIADRVGIAIYAIRFFEPANAELKEAK